MSPIPRLSIITLLFLTASTGPATADPIGDYCDLLKDRLHFCMRAFFGPDKSTDVQAECALAPDQVEQKLKDALDTLPSTGAARNTLEQSYFALVLYIDTFPRVETDHRMTEEELDRLPPIVHQACDRK